MTIPAPTMLHLIACVRTKEYQPIARYQDDEQLIVDLAMAYQKIIQAFYDRGCRYLQLDDTSWGEFCSKEKREEYANCGIDVGALVKKYVYLINLSIVNKPDDMNITIHICRGNFRSTWFSSGGMNQLLRNYLVTVR